MYLLRSDGTTGGTKVLQCLGYPGEPYYYSAITSLSAVAIPQGVFVFTSKSNSPAYEPYDDFLCFYNNATAQANNLGMWWGTSVSPGSGPNTSLVTAVPTLLKTGRIMH